jgi:hypothetical protein
LRLRGDVSKDAYADLSALVNAVGDAAALGKKGATLSADDGSDDAVGGKKKKKKKSKAKKRRVDAALCRRVQAIGGEPKKAIDANMIG